jgi:putative tryptophan/tyrosine transport system substrate-binding protein
VLRRDVIALIGGAALAWPRGAQAQQASKLPTVGYLGSSSAPSAPWVTAFVQRLRELGWIGGHTVAIEYRWTEGRAERFTEIAAELVRLKVDIIVRPGLGALAAKQATSVIPIVFTVANDPVGNGLVAILARPGGNVTGLSFQSSDLAGKHSNSCARLSLVSAVWRFWPTSAIPSVCRRCKRLRQPHARSSSKSPRSKIRRAEDVAPAFEGLKGRSDAVYVVTDALSSTNRVRINTLALGARLPTMHGVREFTEVGGLMSYGANFPDLFRRAADYVDKILRGENPAAIPVEQPTKFEFVINLKTAKPLGATIPPSLLARADEVIE